MRLSEYSSYILPLISGVTIAVVTQIIAHYFSKKSLEAQRENSLKIVRMQLYHEDRKDALVKLDELLKRNYDTYPQFRDAVKAFLDGSSGIFLPNRLRNELKSELSSLDDFLSEKEIELRGPPPEYPPEEYEAWFEDLSPDEQLDIEVENRLSTLKDTMRSKIKNHVSDE